MESLGKEFFFVNEPPLDHFCPVCVELLTEPFLSDCGHHVCRTCRDRLLAIGNAECPECRQPNSLEDARLNRHLQRLVYDLMVRCKHHEEGCNWKGELRNLQEHLDPPKRRCDFVLIPCSFGCGEHVRSGVMKEHKINQCRKRPSTCEHCDYHNAREIITEQHYPICLQFPVDCPNKCMARGLTRSKLQAHVTTKCPLQVIACPFSRIGCTTQRLPRRKMKTHYEDALQDHLLLMLEQMDPDPNQGAINLPSAAVWPPYLFNLPPVEFTMTNYLQLKEADKEWISPPFYTHSQGYNMSLKVDANGSDDDKGTHVSVYVFLMKGEHDDQLQWPFEGDVIIELLNWREDKGHHERKVDFNQGMDKYNDICVRVMQKKRGAGWGYGQFISHSSLSYNPTTNTEYLQDDCLRLRVKTVAVYSTPLLFKTPAWQDSLTASQSLCEFTVAEFSKRRSFNNEHYSHPFYTHPQGYKMCLKTYSNGVGRGKGTHVTISARIMRGEHDNQLQWPFEGDLTIELLNWREDKGHHKESICFNKRTNVRVTESDIGTGWTKRQFIPHSSLSYNPTTNTEYLQDDCLRLRVKRVEIYSKKRRVFL